MSNIKLDIPDITVIVEKGSDNYNVVVGDYNTIITNGSGSYITVADFASTASHALYAKSLLYEGTLVYSTISSSNAYFDNLNVSGSTTINGPLFLEQGVILGTGSNSLTILSQDYSIIGTANVNNYPSGSIFDEGAIFITTRTNYPISNRLGAQTQIKSGSDVSAWYYDADGTSYFPGDVNIGFDAPLSEYLTSGSLNIRNGNINVSGSVNVTAGITGSLFGTSSQTVTASYVLPTGLPAGTVSSSVQINTGSFSGSITSASFASVSQANTLTGTTLASNVVNSSLTSVGTLTGLTVSADATINSVTVGRGGGNSTTNTVVGNGTFTSNTTGTSNTAVGNGALTANTTGTSNAAVGAATLQANTVGINNTAIGTQALTVNTSGSTNTAIGVQSLFSNISGSDNTGVGVSSLRFNTVGTFNTAMGTQALRQNVTGSYNAAFGNDAARLNVSGSFNTAMGSTAMYSNTSGSRNTAVGYAALYSNTIADDNTAIGRFALFSSTGTYNTAIGRNAGSSLTTGNNNTIIGGIAGTAGLSDTVIIGAGTTERLRIDSSGNMSISGSLTTAALIMAVSGTISASGTTSVNLDLNVANYFSVSASAAGTVTWTITNAPPVNRAQSFVIEYTNGGIKTNSWFTNTRWPAATAPILSTGTAPDLLGFTTDDAGANWRGVLLQRGSA
jgi:hypothetical protein